MDVMFNWDENHGRRDLKKKIAYSYSGILLIERTLINSDLAFHMYSILGRSVHVKYDVWNGLEYNLFIYSYAIFVQDPIEP